MMGWETVLSAAWTPRDGLALDSSDLPVVFADALGRVAHDLHVRQYNGSIAHIRWVAEYDDHTGVVFLLSDVTATGRAADGLGASGGGAALDADEEAIVASMAYLVQDQVARARIAWPWGDADGFMSPMLSDGIAVWADHRVGSRSRIGEL
ncbi:hypothetical protein [Gordonia soli]|nr:hypothetical protein [Gordonia soli]